MSDDDDDEIFVVEEIRDHQVRKDKIYYLIKWQGYPENNNTWEPEDNLFCQSILDAYKAEHAFFSQHKQPKRNLKGKAKERKVKYVKRPIKEIVGFKEGSTAQNMIYIVRFEGDRGFSELPSHKLVKWDCAKLIEFYERNLPQL